MLPPIGRERRVLQQQLQVSFVAGLIEQDVGGALHRQLWIRPVHQQQRIHRIHSPLLQHSQQPAAATGELHHQGEVRVAKTLIELEAGRSRLADLDQSGAEAIDIADTGLRLGQSEAGEVFAKGRRLPGGSGGRQAQRGLPGLPPGVVIRGIVVQGAIRAAVMAFVALLIALQAREAAPQGMACLMLVDGTDESGGEFGIHLGALADKEGDPHSMLLTDERMRILGAVEPSTQAA
ncbi:hypothetical protein D3C72_1113390 [compost metagenome]